MSNFINLIPIIEAQGTDAIAQPTFGPVEGSGGSSTGSSILLRSDKTSVNVGDTFKVTIEIKTNELDISEYRLVVSYDPNQLTVIDNDPNKAGTQINLLDTLFQAPNAEDNLVTQGRITLNTKTVSGNAFRVNRDVAEITFQALTQGSTVIKVETGVSGSHLIRLTGSELGYTSNEVTVQTSSAVSPTPTPTPTPQPTPVPQPNTTTTGGTTGTLPNTAIGDPGFFGSIIIGLIFIAIGISLKFSREGKRNVTK